MHPAWTSCFRWDAGVVQPLLTALRRQQGHLMGRATGLGLDLGRDLHADTVVLDALRTAAIEGEQLDPEGVRSSVAKRLGTPTAGRPASRAVDGLIAMLLDATQRADAPLTPDRLHGWHAGLFPTGHSGIRRITVAGWRVGEEPMRVVSGGAEQPTVHFQAPPSDRVADEMAAFLRWWADPTPPIDGLLRAALAHVWFVTVHPYDDGNGRITRALTDMALAQDEGTSTRLYSMSAAVEARREAYYRELEAAQRGDGDLTDWMVWFLDTLGHALRDAETRMDEVVLRARFWQHWGTVALNERQSKVVRRMVQAGSDGFVGGLTTRKYVALTRTSRATAQREIADLVSKGLVRRLAAGGRSTAYALVWPTDDPRKA